MIMVLLTAAFLAAVLALVILLLMKNDWKCWALFANYPQHKKSPQHSGSTLKKPPCFETARKESNRKANLPTLSEAGSLHVFLSKLHEQLGPVASFEFGTQYVVSTAHPDAFRPQKLIFDRPGILFKNFEDLIGSKSIQFANKDYGRSLRNRFDCYFGQSECNTYLPYFIEVGNWLTDKWTLEIKCSSRETSFLIRQDLMTTVLKSILVCLFGDFFKCEKQLNQIALQLDMCSQLGDQLMSCSNTETAERIKDDIRKARCLIFDQLRKVMAQRKQRNNAGVLGDSSDNIIINERLLVDELIEISDSDEQLALDNALTYAIASFHTTAYLLEHLFYYLAKHTQCQDRLAKEMVDVLGTNDEIWPAAVIDEALRLSVLGPYAARISDVDLEICGFWVPKNTPILQSLGYVLQNSNLWPSPNVFDPERFSTDNRKTMDPLSCPFFGFAGKRKCPGYRFAYTEVTALLSVLVRKFRFSFFDNSAPLPEHFFGIVTRPDTEIPLHLEIR